MKEADYFIPRALVRALRDVQPASRPALRMDAEAVVADLERRKLRVQQAYEADVYTLEMAEEKIKAINAELASYRNEESRRLREDGRRAQFLSTVEETRKYLDALPGWVVGDDPRIVNRLLHRMIDRIEVTPGRELSIHFWA